MAKKQVLVSVCDSCTKEVTNEMPAQKDLVLPPEWIIVSVQSSKTDIYEADLCEECKLPVLAAIGKTK